MNYNKEVFDYITLQKDKINQVANQLDVSSEAIAGSIAEEANSIAGKGPIDSFFNNAGEFAASAPTHQDLLEIIIKFIFQKIGICWLILKILIRLTGTQITRQ